MRPHPPPQPLPLPLLPLAAPQMPLPFLNRVYQHALHDHLLVLHIHIVDLRRDLQQAAEIQE